MSRGSYLFSTYQLSDVLRSKQQDAAAAIAHVAEATFLISRDTDLLENVRASYTIDPLKLHEESMTMTQQEAQVDVSGDGMRYFSDRRGPAYIPGTRVSVLMPFTGFSELWMMRTSTWSSMFPTGTVEKTHGQNAGNLKIIVTLPHDADPARFKQMIHGELSLVRQYVGWSAAEVEAYNTSLSTFINQAIADRRKRLARHSGLAELLAIPLASDPSAPKVSPVQLERQAPPPLPVPPKGGLKPEPGITDGDYEHILSIIRHEGRSFETTPATFAGLGEEALRDVVLAHLNGHYRGGASGETFRRNGKTDICIPVDNRSAFVAECKLWKGQGEVAGAIDQLLSYLTWRDSKAALVFFNTSVAGFSALPEKFEAAICAHPLLIKPLPGSDVGEGRYEMRSAEDEGRRITVHAFIFNLFTGKA